MMMMMIKMSSVIFICMRKRERKKRNRVFVSKHHRPPTGNSIKCRLGLSNRSRGEPKLTLAGRSGNGSSNNKWAKSQASQVTVKLLPSIEWNVPALQAVSLMPMVESVSPQTFSSASVEGYRHG